MQQAPTRLHFLLYLLLGQELNFAHFSLLCIFVLGVFCRLLARLRHESLLLLVRLCIVKAQFLSPTDGRQTVGTGARLPAIPHDIEHGLADTRHLHGILQLVTVDSGNNRVGTVAILLEDRSTLA